MKVLKNENNMIILEDQKNDITYLISYKSFIARVCNTEETDKNKKNNYGLVLSKKWNYSRTTLKQLYYFIELYTTQRDTTGNTLSYMLGKEKNKKEYIKKLIDNNIIKLVEEEEI